MTSPVMSGKVARKSYLSSKGERECGETKGEKEA